MVAAGFLVVVEMVLAAGRFGCGFGFGLGVVVVVVVEVVRLVVLLTVVEVRCVELLLLTVVVVVLGVVTAVAFLPSFEMEMLSCGRLRIKDEIRTVSHLAHSLCSTSYWARGRAHRRAPHSR